MAMLIYKNVTLNFFKDNTTHDNLKTTNELSCDDNLETETNGSFLHPRRISSYYYCFIIIKYCSMLLAFPMLLE